MGCLNPIALKAKGNDLVGQVVPCSRCLGCRLERSRQWAVRGMCELWSHDRSSFLTLTYKEENLVWGNSRATLFPKHLQLFLKRLRKSLDYPVRFLACGEYGERTQRPHYHCILYGHDFSEDRRHYSGVGTSALYTSEQLDNLWSLGECKIGSVTFQSVQYVARYILGKKLGKESDNYYKEEGIEPEFVRMSLKPGLGRDWFDRFYSDVFPLDYMVVNGVKCRVPRYFDKILKDSNPFEFERVKEERKIKRENTPEDVYSLRRRKAKSAILAAQLKKRDSQ